MTVVLPAPGGAHKTTRLEARMASRIAPRTLFMGKSSFTSDVIYEQMPHVHAQILRQSVQRGINPQFLRMSL